MLMGYARVSTADQNLDLQRDAMKKAGRKRVFTDQMSGARADRPGLTEALSHAREGDVLVVWRLDRLGRSLTNLIVVVAELEQRGVDFKSLTESIDTTTSGGKLICHIFGALAEFETNLVRDRTLAGLQAARKRCRVGGRPRSMSDEKLQAAKRLLRDGTPPMNVAEIIGVSMPTMYRYLRARKSAA